jgi:hypothetical protein
MTRFALIIGLSLGLAASSLAPQAAFAAEPKAGKGEKVCKIKMKYSGEIKKFVCKVDEPCCVWHEINYVKCGFANALKCI